MKLRVPHRVGAVIVLAAVASVVACGRSTEPQAPAGSNAGELFSTLDIGEQVPVYEVRLLDGSPAQIGPEQPVTLLNLWATWCAPCRKEFPDIQDLHLRLAERGLRVLAVDIDAEPTETLESFAADLGLTLPIARDTAGTIQQAFAPMGVPTSYLISSDGRLVRVWTGVIPQEAYPFIERYVLGGQQKG